MKIESLITHALSIAFFQVHYDGGLFTAALNHVNRPGYCNTLCLDSTQQQSKMFGWKKKKKEKENNKTTSSSSSSGGFSSLNNLLKGSPKAKKGNKHGKTDILSDSQTSGSNSPHSVTDRAHVAANSPTSLVSNGSASPSPSNNSNQITSQFVQSLPPPEYSLRVPPDHSRLTSQTSKSDHPSLRATYTPPPGYGQGGRPGSSASEISNVSRLTAPSAEGIDVDFAGAAESKDVSRRADRSSHPSKPLEDWSEGEILQWLNDSDLEYFADIFQGMHIFVFLHKLLGFWCSTLWFIPYLGTGSCKCHGGWCKLAVRCHLRLKYSISFFSFPPT